LTKVIIQSNDSNANPFDQKSGACLFFRQYCVPKRTPSLELLREFERFGPTGVSRLY
jgi:hypothetical protein